MIETYRTTPEKLAHSIRTAPAYYRPLLESMQFGVAMAVLLPGNIKFDVPLDQPIVVIACDDAPANSAVRGPRNYHRDTLRRVIGAARAAMVTSCEPIVSAYERVAATATLTREPVLVVETTPEHEVDWIDLIQSIKPTIPLLVATAKPRGNA